MPTALNNILKSEKKSIWKWPAVVNMSAGAAASGHFLFSTWAAGRFPDANADALKWFILISPLVMMIGLCTVSLEIGRPRHFIHILSNIKTSWMSREVLAAIIFILLCLAALASQSPSQWLLWSTSAAAMIFILSQGMMVRRCLGVPAWSGSYAALFFISSALASGFGLFQLTCNLTGLICGALEFWSGIGCVVLNAAVWLKIVRDPAFKNITKIQSAASLTATLGFGHIIPMLLLVFGRIAPLLTLPASISDLLMITGALCILSGTAAQKNALIRHTCIINGVPLPCSIEFVSNRMPEE